MDGVHDWFQQKPAPTPRATRVVRLAEISKTPEQKLAARRTTIVIARAVLAEKRAAGTVRPRPRTDPAVLAQRARDQAKAYAERNRELVREKARQKWAQTTEERRELLRQRNREWYARNREAVCAKKQAKRDAAKGE